MTDEVVFAREPRFRVTTVTAHKDAQTENSHAGMTLSVDQQP